MIKPTTFVFLMFFAFPASSDEFLDVIVEYNQLTEALSNVEAELDEYMEGKPRQLAATFGSRYWCDGDDEMSSDIIFELVTDYINRNAHGLGFRWEHMQEDLEIAYDKFRNPEECERQYLRFAQENSLEDIFRHTVLLWQINRNLGLRRLDLLQNNAELLTSR